ncbi:hypothetical protein PHOSAC3_140248 [Mesotoga infera]|nr:hypothetical protein PHOSAC3_140248 [Mesotoga infera]
MRGLSILYCNTVGWYVCDLKNYSKTLLVIKSVEPGWLSIPDSYELFRGRDLFE